MNRSNSNITQLMMQTKNYQKHREKVSAIMNKNMIVNQVNNNKRIRVFNNFYSSHAKAARFSTQKKQKSIDKDNDLIVKKILSVNNRKNQSIRRSATARDPSHNSLTNLKRSLSTINSQNQKIAHKLVSANSNLRQQKMSQSYRKHLQRKEMLLKYNYDEEMGMVIPKRIQSMQRMKFFDTLKNEETLASRLRDSDSSRLQTFEDLKGFAQSNNY